MIKGLVAGSARSLIGLLLLWLSLSVNAQVTPDPTFPLDYCKQNAGAAKVPLDCKRGVPPKTPPWGVSIIVAGVSTRLNDDDPENLRDQYIATANQEQIQLGSTTRYRANPNTANCSEPWVVNNHPSGNRRVVSALVNCAIQQVNSQLTPTSPSYVVNDIALVAGKFLRCPAGWWARGSGPPNQFGDYDKYPHVCIPDTPPKELGKQCPCEGNPITVSNGNKYQAEIDYTGNGAMPLRLVRYYNSVSSISDIQLGENWRLEYDRRLIREGINSISVTRPSGKFYLFLLNGGNWTATSDIADRVSPILDAGGATIGWRYYEASTQHTETYSTTGLLQSITDLVGNVTTLQYSDTSTPSSIAPTPGYLVSVTDPQGRALSFTYSTNGVLASAQDPAGGTYLYAYDSGNLASVTRPDGAKRTYIYNEPSNNGATASTWHLTGIIDENQNRFATYRYDSGGRAWSSEWSGGVNHFTVSNSYSVTTPLGYTKSFQFSTVNTVRVPIITTVACASTGCTGTQTENSVYDANNNLTAFTNLRGTKTCHAYDLSRNLETARVEGLPSTANCATALAAATQTAPARKVTTTWHPTFRLPAAVTEPLGQGGLGGNKVTTNTYDARGNLEKRIVTVPKVGGGTESRTWAWTYDSLGRVKTATDPLGRVSTNTYYPNTEAQHTTQPHSRGMLASTTNALGHTTTINEYNPHGQPLTITDANGLVTVMTYDARQRLKTRKVGEETTSYDYDGVGQLKKVTMPDGSTLHYEYDGAHRLVEVRDGLGNKMVYTLDNAGNRVKEEALDPAGALARTRTREYDALNRLHKDIGGATPATQVTQYAYDANGNQVSATDPLARVTTNSYDALNRLLQVVDPVNGVAAPTKYEYDAQDNLTKVIDPKNLATVYTYNGFNELTSQTSPDTGVTTFTYDAAGNMLTKTDARMRAATTSPAPTITYTYDNLNRIKSIAYPAVTSPAATGSITAPAQIVTYNYDGPASTCPNGIGRLCSITDRTGTTSYRYDLHGRVVQKAQTVSGLTQTIDYQYNLAGQMERMTLPSGRKVNLTYTNNRITGMTVESDGNTSQVIKLADYEPFGPVGEWTWGNDTVTTPNKHTRYFDLDGRNTKIESGRTGANPLDPTIIVYDAASRITALQRLTNPASPTSTTIDPARSTSYGYDNLDRLTSVTPGAGNPASTQAYTYDAIGNRLTNTVNGSQTTYNYGTTSHRLNSLAGAIAKTYTYDAVGNRINDGIQSWIYGGDNRPSAISIASGGATTTPISIQSGINALGQRVLKTVNGGGSGSGGGGTGGGAGGTSTTPNITRFVYDEAGRLIGEYDLSGKPIQETIWFNDLPVAVLK
jgi:YD repeat-containing protein